MLSILVDVLSCGHMKHLETHERSSIYVSFPSYTDEFLFYYKLSQHVLIDVVSPIILPAVQVITNRRSKEFMFLSHLTNFKPFLIFLN